MRPNICRRWSLAAGTEHIPATRKRCWRVAAPKTFGPLRCTALFAATWVIALVIWRLGRIEERRPAHLKNSGAVETRVVPVDPA